MFGQIVAFLAIVASVAYASSCGRCYSGYGRLCVNPVPITCGGVGGSRVLSTGCDSFSSCGTPVASSCTAPIISSCSSPVVSSCATPVVSSCATPVVSSCATPVVSSCATPVVSSCATPIVSSCSSPSLSFRSCGSCLFSPDVCDNARVYSTPLFRSAVGCPEVISSCENSPLASASYRGALLATTC